MSGDDVGWPFNILGLDTADGDRKAIKRAYAKRLKQIDQAQDPVGFQALREAYEFALGNLNTLSAASTPKPEFDEHPTPSGLEKVVREPTERPIVEIDKKDLPIEETPDLTLSEEDRARVDDLHEELQALLDLPFDNARWAALVRDPILDVFEFANEIEHSIFGGVFTRLETKDSGQKILPAFITPRWIELIDQRFGWTQDLPLFQRKFGWHGGTILPLLSERRHQNSSRPAQAYAPPAKMRRSWLQTTIMLCAGYTLLRSLVLVVLP